MNWNSKSVSLDAPTYPSAWTRWKRTFGTFNAMRNSTLMRDVVFGLVVFTVTFVAGVLYWLANGVWSIFH